MADEYKGKKSKDDVKRIQELRRSNSATPHDSRSNRERTRTERDRKAVKDSE